MDRETGDDLGLECDRCEGFLVLAEDGLGVYLCSVCGRHFDQRLNPLPRTAPWCGEER